MAENNSFKVKAASALFILAAFFIVAMAVSIQIIFSEKKVEGWAQAFIDKNISQYHSQINQVKVTFEKANITFLASFRYPIGLRVRGLRLDLKSSCHNLSGRLETLVVPLHFRKALQKKMDLGMVRLSGGTFDLEENCKESSPEGASSSLEKANRGKRLNRKISKILEQVQKYIFKQVLHVKESVRYKGFLFYDLKLKNSKRDYVFHLGRFKSLFGLGELRASGEWSSSLLFKDETTYLKGNFKAYNSHVFFQSNFKEKEAEVFSTLVLSHDKKGEPLLKGNIKIANLPLTSLSRFYSIPLDGLNLRKTWVKGNMDFSLSRKEKIFFLKNLSGHGDFGLVESRSPVKLYWSDEKKEWQQEDIAEIKIKDFNLKEALTVEARKKLSSVLGDFGKLNAYLEVKNLNKAEGDFEVSDVLVLFRSMGKYAKQFVSFARGTFSFEFKKKLTFDIKEAGLKEGDFDGLLQASYDYKSERINLRYNIEDLLLNQDIYQLLFGLRKVEGLKIEGKASFFKSSFYSRSKRTQGAEFKIFLSSLEAPHWSFKNIGAACSYYMDLSAQCSLLSGEMSLSKSVQELLGLARAKFDNVKTKKFQFENKSLQLEWQHPNLKSSLKTSWTKSEGGRFYLTGSQTKVVNLRDL